jgi:hypothetical protein
MKILEAEDYDPQNEPGKSGVKAAVDRIEVEDE